MSQYWPPDAEEGVRFALAQDDFRKAASYGVAGIHRIIAELERPVTETTRTRDGKVKKTRRLGVAGRALVCLKHAAEDEVLKVLNNGNQKEAAAMILGHIGRPRSLPSLIAALEDQTVGGVEYLAQWSKEEPPQVLGYNVAEAAAKAIERILSRSSSRVPKDILLLISQMENKGVSEEVMTQLWEPGGERPYATNKVYRQGIDVEKIKGLATAELARRESSSTTQSL